MVVAAFASWHEAHASANSAIVGDVRLPAHCAFEVYSVLTRLPPPHRVERSIARDFLRLRFPKPLLTIDADESRMLLDALVERGISGGACYDALVGQTAALHRAQLVTRDRRAAKTYRLLDVDFELID